MNTPTQHAPTPWSRNQWGETIGIDNKDFMNLAVINPNGDHSKGIPSRFDAANAAFIVTACNAHDDLLEALNNLDSLTNVPAVRKAMDKAGYMAQFQTVKFEARAAIAKATGRS